VLKHCRNRSPANPAWPIKILNEFDLITLLWQLKLAHILELRVAEQSFCGRQCSQYDHVEFNLTERLLRIQCKVLMVPFESSSERASVNACMAGSSTGLSSVVLD